MAGPRSGVAATTLVLLLTLCSSSHAQVWHYHEGHAGMPEFDGLYPDWEDAGWDRYQTEFTSDLGINWMAPFFSGGGYASEATALAFGLNKYIKLSVQQHGGDTDFNYMNGLPEEVRYSLSEMRSRSLPLGMTIQVCHSEVDAWEPKAKFHTARCPSPSAAYRIGRTMTVTDRLPMGWKRKLNMMDEVWVPSRHHYEQFLSKGVRAHKLLVVPQPAPVYEFDPADVEEMDLPGGGDEEGRYFRFLSIFSWEHRKGWDLLLRAYLSEFSIHDRVVLYIRTDKFRTTEALMSHVATLVRQGTDMSEFPRIVALPLLHQKDMPSLYKSVDAFVLPTRGEGWSRTVTEAMCMELPVIATHVGGLTEYLREDNSFPVETDGTSHVPDGELAGHKMGEPSLSHLRQRMMEVFDDREEGFRRGVRARRDMISQFRPERVAQFILHHMQRIADALENRRPEL